ncbi:MAG: PKD domain-containing protein, partial [Bacteroidetes bacterium]|nr:PKD domain-containing protein [Bacteroidota bacterium]
MSLFSYGATFEVVRFINQSAVSNAHYWWNFGDGTGANCKHPVHTYPETGRYLVTLFTKDTVGNCSDYYEIWVNVTKYSTDTCAPAMTDSLFTSAGIDYLKIIDLSTNCGGYSISVDAGPAANSPAALWIGIDSSWAPARFLSRLQYFAYDTIIGYQLIREAYKSTPYKFTSSINYDDCSANFEFTVIQEDSAGQRVF